MKAVIMAGGEGTRLRPLTYNQPKPLIPMANKALMEHVVALLREHSFTDLVVTVGFQANALQAYFGDGADFGVRMVYANEGSPLGTAGSVRNAMSQLDETFLVISGDVLTDIDLSLLVTYHADRKAIATIALHTVENPLEFGLVITNEDGTVQRFLEKPTWGQVFSDTINTGIYVLEPDIFDYIPAGAVDFSSDVFPGLLGGGRVFGCATEGYWEDIGALEAYARAHEDILDGRVRAGISGFALREGVWLGQGAEVSPDAEVKGPAIVGDYCSVAAGATLGPYTVLGRNVRVSPGTYLERAIVHDNAYIGPGVQLRGCIVGRSTDLRRGARVEEGAVLGDECFIGEQVVVQPGVKVYPFKTVEHGAVVNSSIIWESKGSRSLFGRNGVSGLANVDVSPELAQRLAMAYATTMARGASVTVSRDTSRAARILKQSVAVGLNAAGVDVADLEVATVPVTRFTVRNEHAAGGVTVGLSPEDPQSVHIRFLDAEGIDINEAAQRKIERTFYREDFRRCLASEIGDLRYPVRAPDFYAQTLLEQVDVGSIRAARFKVVLDYAYGATTFVMPLVLGKLGAEVLSLNPYAAAQQSVHYDRWEHACSVSTLVRASAADFGVVLSPDGERVTLVDDTGRILSDNEGLMVLLALVLRHSDAGWGHGKATIALPVSAASAAEEMCRRAGASLVSTKMAASHLMEAASAPGVQFAAGQEGGYIFPAFLPAFDAVAALAHTFALLAATGARLSAVVAGLPPVWTAHESVVTPWEKKGLVMRSVMALGRERPAVLVDGVKLIHDDGWCLIVPDPEEALTHVWAEAASDAAAMARATEYARHIRQVLRA